MLTQEIAIATSILDILYKTQNNNGGASRRHYYFGYSQNHRIKGGASRHL
jgi:hypothetical protein